MKNLFKKLGKALLGRSACLVLAVVVATVCLPHFAFAADTPESTPLVKDLAEFLAIMIRFLNTLLWPFLIILGDLMDVDMILGPGMEDRLVSIYNAVRNLVDISFVIVLLVVAFYNVLGIGGGEGDLAIKTALPKIVLGLVLVNFTLPIGRVMLDITNVGTNIAFGIPNVVDGYKFAPELEQFTQDVCLKTYSVDSSGVEVETHYKVDDEENTPIQTQFLCQDANGDGDYDSLNSIIGTTYFSDMNKNNLGLIMAVNMGKLGALNILKEGKITNFEDLTVNMLFSVMMFSVFAISYIVMGLVLLARIFVLWIALALSPLAVLAYVVPQIKEWAGGGGDFSKKVVKHLISPIIMGVTLSFGYLLMDAWNSVSQGSSNAFNSLAIDNVISAEFLVSGIDDLPKLILAVASIVVVWTGIFAAANDTFAQGITDGIKGFGERVKDAAIKAPLLLGTVPIGVKNGHEQSISPAGVYGLLDQGLRTLEYGKFADKDSRILADKVGWGDFLYGEGGASTERDPVANTKSIMDTLGKASGGSITNTELAEIAQRLMNNVEGNKSITEESKRTSLMDELDTVRKEAKAGNGGETRALETLKEIINKKNENDELQMGAASPVRAALQKVNKVTKEAEAAPATPATPATPPPAPVTAAMQKAITDTLAKKEFTDAQAALTGAATATPVAGAPGPSADLTAAHTDLTAAATAARGLTPASDAKAVEEATKAVSKAKASLEKLKKDPNHTANATAASKGLDELPLTTAKP